MRFAVWLSLVAAATWVGCDAAPGDSAAGRLAARVAFKVPCGSFPASAVFAVDGQGEVERLLACPALGWSDTVVSDNLRWLALRREGAGAGVTVLDVLRPSRVVTIDDATWIAFVGDVIFVGIAEGDVVYDVLTDDEPAQHLEGTRLVAPNPSARSLIAYGERAVLFQQRADGSVAPPVEIVARSREISAVSHHRPSDRVYFVNGTYVLEVDADGGNRDAPRVVSPSGIAELRWMQVTPDGGRVLLNAEQPVISRTVDLSVPPGHLFDRLTSAPVPLRQWFDCWPRVCDQPAVVVSADSRHLLVDTPQGLATVRTDGSELSAPRVICSSHSSRSKVDPASERVVCVRRDISVATLGRAGSERRLVSVADDDHVAWISWADNGARIVFALERRSEGRVGPWHGELRDLQALELRAVPADGSGPDYPLIPLVSHYERCDFFLGPDGRFVVVALDGRLYLAPTDGSAAAEPLRSLAPDFMGQQTFLGFVATKEAP